MTELVIPAAGAAVGWFVGGSTGAGIGWTIGSYFSNSKEEPEQQEFIGDLRVQTSQYGTVVPMVNGKQRLAGNIIWATDKTVNETTSGGGGGKGGSNSEPESTVTTYSVSLAIAICKGPILGITRVWEDGTLKAAVGSGQTKLPGTLYTGSDSQNPDATIESFEGAGNVPAYRGLTYIVLNNFNLGVSGRIPFFSFEVLKQVPF